jgi:structural maintenance of chromosome 4
VPDSSLVVTRTAYRNNTSKYTINNKGSTFSEVQALLKGRGIDLDHKRFLILQVHIFLPSEVILTKAFQGEVESIAQMKPKATSEHDEGLLEYLEDIIGTSKYKDPIEEALGEMERFGEERTEKVRHLSSRDFVGLTSDRIVEQVKIGGEGEGSTGGGQEGS